MTNKLTFLLDVGKQTLLQLYCMAISCGFLISVTELINLFPLNLEVPAKTDISVDSNAQLRNLTFPFTP